GKGARPAQGRPLAPRARIFRRTSDGRFLPNTTAADFRLPDRSSEPVYGHATRPVTEWTESRYGTESTGLAAFAGRLLGRAGAQKCLEDVAAIGAAHERFTHPLGVGHEA